MVMILSDRGRHNGFSTGFVARHYSEEKLPERYRRKKVSKRPYPTNKRELTAAEASKIRKLCDEHKLTQRQIAAMFHCSKVTVNKIAHRVTWKNLPSN